ncbi:ArsR/SmtB family transcription factor [Micromonospora inyonensis]|uniref:DNA-binding transcriptional regulator, ArsR family n=1 Tax=Micromonospora inyonensis TaxID=47866 RepID=A0A1C6S8B3_9ACTN|nr:winged helix-turn-helix domain-containing protein [Micromonospora inyonensis]SCL25716.1 DNA-binding transcriptional regulator, ArsR family [Micromonospora inyonensis]
MSSQNTVSGQSGRLEGGRRSGHGRRNGPGGSRVHEATVGLATVAGLLADHTRAAFCLALLDGRAWTATELARHAGVAPSTATAHLHRLVAGGLVTEVRQGRHRYLRLADAGVAELIETLTGAAPVEPAPVRSLSAASRRRALAHARTCYDHLAGALGVAVTDAMTGHGFLSWERGLSLTDRSTAWLAGLGIAPESTAPTRRAPVRACLDWTERRPHLAGTIGAALCRHALDAGWAVRIGTGRALAVTAEGRRAFREHLDLPGRVLDPQPRPPQQG